MNLQRLTCLVLVTAILVGCSREYSGDRRFALSGKVTLDGTPIDYGAISFIPAAGEQRVSGGTIVDGVYSVPEEEGANEGKYRVEIRWFKKTGKQFLDPETQTMMDRRDEGLPAKYHKDSILTADVSADQATFDFDLKSG
ncbi:MAG: hypothetical protein AB7O38_04040 [Pirellulaceae bacterium]